MVRVGREIVLIEGIEKIEKMEGELRISGLMLTSSRLVTGSTEFERGLVMRHDCHGRKGS